MEKITSPDGTVIAYHIVGAGPPLILVAGTGAANPLAWTGVLPMLEQDFTVYAVDRRGRGQSGDGSVYAVEREFEDLAAVVDSTGQPANLVGHSFGALLALEAAFLTRNLRKLILYEPWLPRTGVSLFAEGFIERLEAMLEVGDHEGALITHYRENAGMSPDDIAAVQASPAWPERLATAFTLPREMRAEEGYRFDAQRFKGLHTPTLLLVGGDSPQHVRESTETLNSALPDSRIAVMPGQQHLAMYTAPDLFCSEILRFLTGPG